jgi:hypothetical protein
MPRLDWKNEPGTEAASSTYFGTSWRLVIGTLNDVEALAISL